jgi:hypothetical protein
MAINDTAIDDVIITGDFNDNQLDYSRTKISFLLTKFSLLQMIDFTPFTTPPPPPKKKKKFLVHFLEL